MARYNRIRGPAAPFIMPAPFTLVPGMSITGQWDTGPILLIARARVSNGGPAAAPFAIQLWEDGVTISTVPMFLDLAATSAGTIPHTHLHLPAPGTHTYALAGSGNAAVTSLIPANAAELIAIQLNPENAAADLVAL